MNISLKHLAGKPRKIGHLNGAPVMELATTGGLNLVVVQRSGKVETLGAGPHRAVARHIAMKKEPAMVLTDLAKADHVPEEMFAWCLEKYEAQTNYLRQLQGF